MALRGDGYTVALVELGEQMEQQHPASLTEWRVAEPGQYHNIGVHEAVGLQFGFASDPLLLQGIDEFTCTCGWRSVPRPPAY